MTRRPFRTCGIAAAFCLVALVRPDRLRAQSAQALFDQARALETQGKAAEAIAAYTRAIAVDPRFSEAYRRRALTRIASGDRQGAIVDFTHAIDVDPRNAHAYNGRASSRMNLKDYAGAMKDLDSAIVLEPNYVGAWSNRGRTKADGFGDLAGGLADVNKALEFDPKDRVTLWVRADLKARMNNAAGAIEDFTTVISLDPRDPNPLVLRGRLLAAGGDTKGAERDFKGALSINPNLAPAKEGLAALAPGKAVAAWDASAEAERARSRPSSPAPAPAAAPASQGAAAAPKPAVPAPSASVTMPDVDPVMMTPKLDPAVLGTTSWGGQAAVALESMRVLMGPLSPEEQKKFETMWAAHIQHPSEETDAYFAALNPKLQELASLRSSLGEAAFQMEASWQDAVMAAGYGAEPAAEEALAQVKMHGRTVHGLDKRLQSVAGEIASKGPPPDALKAQQEAKKRHIEATKTIRQLLRTLYPSAVAAAATAPGAPPSAATAASGAWTLVRVEKKSSPLRASSEWDNESGIAGLRIPSASMVVSDGVVTGSASQEIQTTNFQRGGEQVVTKYASNSRISWSAPPTSAGVGTTWNLGLSGAQNGAKPQQLDLIPNAGLSLAVEQAVPGWSGGANTVFQWGGGPSTAPSPFTFSFPAPERVPVQLRLVLLAGSVAGSASFTYVYEAGTAATPGDVEIVDEYPAEGRVGELAAEIRFTEGSVDRLRAELQRETNQDRRSALQEQVLQAETSIQRDKDLIASIQTGQPVYTRTAWDDRASALMVSQMRDEVNRMAELERNQATVLRLSQALLRFADSNPAEATEMKAFVQRQLVESGAAAKGDVTKARAVSKALGDKVLGTFEGKAAKNEADAVDWDEYTYYAKTTQSISTTVVGMLAAEVAPLVTVAPLFWSRVGTAVYAGSTGYIATGSPTEAAKEAASWAHPIAAFGIQAVSGYQEGGTMGMVEGMGKGLAIGFIMHGSTTLATKAAGKYNYRFTPPRPAPGAPVTVQDYVESREFRERAATGKAKVRAFEEAQQNLKSQAAGADAATLQRLQNEVNARANLITEDMHAKFYLLKSGQASPQTRRLFSLHHETTHLNVQKRFESIMTEEMGFNPQKHQPVRNATSEGTAGMDYDLALVEHPAFVRDAGGALVKNNWLTRNGKPATVSEYQDAASRAYRRAFRDVTGGDANKAWENVITSVNAEAYKDVGTGRPSVSDPDSFLHPDAGSGKFGGWIDLRNPQNVAALKKGWARQAGDVTEVKGWEFTNPEDLAWKGMTKAEGMHEAVRGTAKDVDKLLTLVNQAYGRAEGANATNLLAARNHWMRVQETMTSYAKGEIGPISFRHKLSQMTGRSTVNEVIADLGNSLEVIRTMPPG